MHRLIVGNQAVKGVIKLLDDSYTLNITVVVNLLMLAFAAAPKQNQHFELRLAKSNDFVLYKIVGYFIRA